MALGTVGCVVLMLWRGVPTIHRLRLGTDLVIRHAQETGGSVGVISVVEAGAPIPGREERAALRRDLLEVAPVVVATALVAEGTSRWVATVFDWLANLDPFLGTSTREKVCVDVPEGAAWLCFRLAEAGLATVPPRDVIASAIEELRAHMPR